MNSVHVVLRNHTMYCFFVESFEMHHIFFFFFTVGMNWAQDEVESSYLFEHFVGCLRNVQLKSGSDLSIVTPLKASAHRDIVEGCVDKFV